LATEEMQEAKVTEDNLIRDGEGILVLLNKWPMLVKSAFIKAFQVRPSYRTYV